MKKPIITMIFCLLGAVALAQTTKGTISLGGAIGVQSIKEEVSDDEFGIDGTINTTTIFISPSAGFFLADGMELGLDLSFSSAKEKLDPDDGDSQDGSTLNETALGPYFKYYLFTSNERFAFTLNASLLFGFSKESFPDEFEIDDRKGSSLQFTVSPGFSYFFTDKIGLDFELQGIGFRSVDPNTDSDFENDKSSEFIFGVSSFNPSLGFKYYFGR
jgi:hypothetical protein